MPLRGYASIRTQTAKLNIAKGGSTAIYVDGNASYASDYLDGYSWERPKKTITAALLAASPWTEIYIRTGSYPENITIPYENIILHGVTQDGDDKASICPESGVPITVTAGYCEIHNLSIVSQEDHAVVLTGPGHKIHDNYIAVNSSSSTNHNGIYLNDCDRAEIYNNHLDGKGGENDIGVLVTGGSVDCKIHDNYFVDWGGLTLAGYGIGVDNAQRCEIIRNIFNSGYAGIYFYTRVGAQLHSVFGNQFYANSSWDIDDTNSDANVSGIRICNNFFGYTGWFDDDDHDGLADSAVTCNLNTDYVPISAPHFLTQLFVAGGGGGGASSIQDFDGFDCASLDSNRWGSAVEVGGTVFSLSSGELKLSNSGAGAGGISYLPSAATYGQLYRHSSHMRIASTTGSLGDIHLTLIIDSDNYIKFGPYKGGAVNDNAYLRYKVAGGSEVAVELASSSIDTTNLHWYMLLVIANNILVYYDNVYKMTIPFPAFADYYVRIEGGTGGATDTLDARVDDYENFSTVDILQLLMLHSVSDISSDVSSVASDVTDIASDVSDLLDRDVPIAISGSVVLEDASEVLLEFPAATYGTLFEVNVFFDLEGQHIDYCYLYDAGLSSYTDYTVEANSLELNSLPLVSPTGPNAGDIIYFGHDSIFTRLDVYKEQSISNTDNTIVWEGWTGAAWVSLSGGSDGTEYGGFALGKSGSVTFTNVLAKTTVNGVEAYWIRARVTSAGSSTPTASHVQISPSSETGFDARAAFLSTLDVRVYRNTEWGYSLLPVDLGLPFTQCILYRTPDISGLLCWDDIAIGLQLSAVPDDAITIKYSGVVINRDASASGGGGWV